MSVTWVLSRDGSVIPKFGKKVGNGNVNSNYQNAVESEKIGKKVSKILLKDSRKNGKYTFFFYRGRQYRGRGPIWGKN